MYQENKIKRRPWTKEEKISALTSCASRCACCGTKLNLSTLTMEHVIPISKGGENTLSNLVVLCKKCNSEKGNKFFWPCGYYMSLNNNGKLRAIDNYTHSWVSNNITREHLELYPMITEAISFYMKPKEMDYKIKNGTYIPSLVLDICEITQEDLKKYPVKRKDIYNSVVDKDKPFSLIAAIKRTDKNCVSMYTVQIIKESIFLSEIFSSTKGVSHMVPIGLIHCLGSVWYDLGVDISIVRLKNEKVASELFMGYMSNSLNMPMKYLANNSSLFDYVGKKDSPYGNGEILFKFFGEGEIMFKDVMKSVREDMRKCTK